MTKDKFGQFVYNEDDVIDILKEGVMMCDPHSEPLEKVAEIGRKYTSSKKQF